MVKCVHSSLQWWRWWIINSIQIHSLNVLACLLMFCLHFPAPTANKYYTAQLSRLKWFIHFHFSCNKKNEMEWMSVLIDKLMLFSRLYLIFCMAFCSRCLWIGRFDVRDARLEMRDASSRNDSHLNSNNNGDSKKKNLISFARQQMLFFDVYFQG